MAFLNLLQRRNFIIIVDYTYLIGDGNQMAILYGVEISRTYLRRFYDRRSKFLIFSIAHTLV